MAEVMTGAELAATPAELRYYVCQSCGERGTDPEAYRMIVLAGIGWVTCKKCLGGEAGE